MDLKHARFACQGAELAPLVVRRNWEVGNGYCARYRKWPRHRNGHRRVSRPPRSQGDCDNEKSKQGHGPAEKILICSCKEQFPEHALVAI